MDPASAEDVPVLTALIERSHLVLDADHSDFHHISSGSPGNAARITITDEHRLGNSSIVGFAASGGMSCSGWPGKPPANAPSWLALDGASIYAAMMGGVALLVRERHGVRLDYQIPYAEAAIRSIAPWHRHLHAAGVNSAGQGIDPGRCGAGPYPVMETRDGHVKLVVATPRQLDALVDVLGSPAELLDDIWSDREFRRANVDVFFGMCAEHVRQHETFELFHEGQKRGLTISPLLSMRQFRADDHAVARGMFIEVDDPEFGRLEMLRTPMVTEPADLLADFRPAPALDSARDRVTEILSEPPRILNATGDLVDPRRPLADIRLLQLGSGAVVPEACSDFALLGADVLRVESMVNQDFLRRGGIDGDIDCSPTYNQLNLGVRSVAVDMTQPEAQRIVEQLLDQSDALVENMRAPVVENWGFDYESCRRRQTDVICLSSQGFGRGPYGHYQSFGPNLTAYSGAASQWAHPDDPVPVGASIPHPDHVAGKQAFVALLAALRRRDLRGQGCFIEAAQVEAPAHLISDRFLAQTQVDADLPPPGNRSPDFAPHGCYPCLDDEWIALAVETDSQWESLAALISEPWTHDPAFATAAGRVVGRTDLEAGLAAWTNGRVIEAVENDLASAGVPGCRVMNSDHFAIGAGNEPGGLFAEVDHPRAGRLPVTGMPVLTTAGERPEALRSPRMGEHTDAIIGDLADCDAATIAALRNNRIIGY